jgi:hypothetical protein
MVGMDLAATDKPPRIEHRVNRPDASDTDDQLDVAIPLSHWTEPAAAQSKNAEVSDAHWSSENGGERAALAPASRIETPTRAGERALATYAVPAVPLHPRHVVFMLLAVLAVAIAVSASVAIFVERQFTPRVATPTTNSASR